MSKSAPWIALAIDWQDSEMLDDSNHGERLAWICLLCFAKAQGRAGKVRFRGKKFAENYRLSVESVDAMVARAATAGAVIVDGDVLTVVNWKDYQDPRARSSGFENHRENGVDPPERRHFSKSTVTPHPPPSTKERKKKRETPLPPLPESLDGDLFREKLSEWLEYKGHSYKPQGLRAMVSRAEKLAGQFGVEAVVEAMEIAMANGWQGWDQKTSFEKRGPHGRRRDNAAGNHQIGERGL